MQIRSRSSARGCPATVAHDRGAVHNVDRRPGPSSPGALRLAAPFAQGGHADVDGYVYVTVGIGVDVDGQADAEVGVEFAVGVGCRRVMSEVFAEGSQLEPHLVVCLVVLPLAVSAAQPYRRLSRRLSVCLRRKQETGFRPRPNLGTSVLTGRHHLGCFPQ